MTQQLIRKYQRRGITVNKVYPQKKKYYNFHMTYLMIKMPLIISSSYAQSLIISFMGLQSFVCLSLYAAVICLLTVGALFLSPTLPLNSVLSWTCSCVTSPTRCSLNKTQIKVRVTINTIFQFHSIITFSLYISFEKNYQHIF